MRPIAKGLGRSRLRSVIAYAPQLRLELVDRELALDAPPADAFGPAEHEILAAQELAGFRARQAIIADRTLVEVRGVLRRVDDDWRLRVRELIVVSG